MPIRICLKICFHTLLESHSNIVELYNEWLTLTLQVHRKIVCNNTHQRKTDVLVVNELKYHKYYCHWYIENKTAIRVGNALLVSTNIIRRYRNGVCLIVGIQPNKLYKSYTISGNLVKNIRQVLLSGIDMHASNSWVFCQPLNNAWVCSMQASMFCDKNTSRKEVHAKLI